MHYKLHSGLSSNRMIPCIVHGALGCTTDVLLALCGLQVLLRHMTAMPGIAMVEPAARVLTFIQHRRPTSLVKALEHPVFLKSEYTTRRRRGPADLCPCCCAASLYDGSASWGHLP